MGLQITLLITQWGLNTMSGMRAGSVLPLSTFQVIISGHHQVCLFHLTLLTAVLILIEAFISICGISPSPEVMGQPIHTRVVSAP